MTLEIVALPAWRGGLLAAEYDRARDIIRVSTVAIERIREKRGDAAADTFVRCALAHETYHRDHPSASEADAHRHVERTCGSDPAQFDFILRG